MSASEEDSRVVLHFDLDAFYVACERELNPQLRHVPVAVSQYNPFGNLEERSSDDIHGRWVVKKLRESDKQEKEMSDSDPKATDDTNGSLIAVSYEARALGVKRNQRGHQACQLCPTLNIIQVPVKHGKADLTMYRSASKRIMEALRKFVVKLDGLDEKNGNTSEALEKMIVVEVASIDEVYIDVTKLANQLVQRIRSDSKFWLTVVQTAGQCTTIGGIEVLSEAAQATNSLGKDELRRGSSVQVLDSSVGIDTGSQAWWNRELALFDDLQLRMVCGAYLAANARRLVQSSFDGGVFTLSAGVSSNKTLAKLASGLKKPDRQTLIYRDPRVLRKLFHPLPLGRIRGLGGKFGDIVSKQLGVETVGQLAEIPLSRLQYILSQNGNSSSSGRFLYDISKGLCTDPVTPRSKPKSIECSKTFRGPLSISINETTKLEKWIGELCGELQERLQQDKEEYSRYASTVKVSVQFNIQKSFLSKQTRAPPHLDQYPNVIMAMTQSLIEIAKAKASSSSFNVRDLKITGMGVGGMQFVDIAAGSASILSAMQKVAQNTTPSPIKPSSATAQVRYSNLFGRGKKRSSLEVWLQQSS